MSITKDRLKEFYLNLEKIRKEISKANKITNIFDILKINKVEIRHSNFLSWLLTPNESHGLNNEILKNFLFKLYDNHFDFYSEKLGKDYFWELSKIDFSSFTVEREYPTREGKYIDIIIYSEKEKIVIAIENKVASNEHSNQLQKYSKFIKDEFKIYDKQFFVLLTPDLREAEEDKDKEMWKTFGYGDFYKIINEELKYNFNKLESNTRQYIKDYLEILRRDIMGENKEIETICAKIYEEYRDVIDIINQNIPDERVQISQRAKTKIIESKFLLDSDRQNTYIHFTTDKMREMFGDKGDGTWCNNLNDVVLFEIINENRNWFAFTCHLGPCEDKDLRKKIFDFAKNYKEDDLFNSAKRLSEKYVMLHKIILSYDDLDTQWEKVKETILKIEEAFEKEFLK